MPPRTVSQATVDAFLTGLKVMVPEPRCELDHRSPWELLVATQLSAQSTDAMVNKVTPTLFARWPTPADLAAADPLEVEAVVKPTGFFRQKTKNAMRTAQIVVDRFGGEVPRTMDELLELPGVARKTANVVLGTAFGIQSGITVDTHVFRVTARWGWHAEKAPEKVEKLLMGLVPRSEWSDFGHRAVLFGRYHCVARAPKCTTCALREICPVGRGERAP